MRSLSLMLLCSLGAACGESDADSNRPREGGRSSAGNASVAGASASAGGGMADPSKQGGAAGQGMSGASTSGGVAAGGASGAAAAGDDNAGLAGESGVTNPTDPRPGCRYVPLIELSEVRLVQAAGPGDVATFELDVTNGTPEFVSYNPVRVSCAGDFVEYARDRLVTFGISEGITAKVELEVKLHASAQTGDVAECIVRGFILGMSPEDCANAETQAFELTVE